MTTLQVMWWLLALSGVVQIVTQGSIFEGFRRKVADRSRFFGELIHCPLCFGVWVAGWMTLVGFGSPSTTLLFWPSWMAQQGKLAVALDILARLIAAILDGAALSLVAFGWTVLRGWLSRPAVVPSAAHPPVTEAVPRPRAVEAVPASLMRPFQPAMQPFKAALPPCPISPPEEASKPDGFQSGASPA